MIRRVVSASARMTCGPHMVPRRYSTPALTAQRSTFKSVEIGNRVAAAAYLVAGSGSPCLRGQSDACRWGQPAVAVRSQPAHYAPVKRERDGELGG